MPLSEEERVIREVIRRWNEGTWTIDPALIHPEIELLSTLTNSRWRGHVGVQAWIDEIAQHFESWHLVFDSMREFAPHRWLALGNIRARGKTSGLTIDQPTGWVIELRDGLIYRFGAYIGHATAEAAAAQDEA